MTHIPLTPKPLLIDPAPASGRTLRRFAAWAVESRGRRVLCMLVGLWTINLFDLLLTLLAHEQGLLDEANPVARRMLSLGPQVLTSFKILLVASGSLVFIRYRRHRLCEMTAALMLLLYAGVAIRWRLCYELYAITQSSRPSMADLEAVESWALALPFL